MARTCTLNCPLMPGQPSPPVAHGSLPLQRRPADQRLWLSLCLIHPRPRPFNSGHGPLVRAGQGRWWPVVNGGAQYSKACEGATLPWVQIRDRPDNCQLTDRITLSDREILENARRPADRRGRCAVQHDRKLRTELGFSHVRWALTRASVVAEAAVSRRGCRGSVATPAGSNWPSLTRSSSGLATPSAWSASVVGR
jgi:hypothetical protein